MFITWVSGAKTAEPIEMPLYGLTCVGPRNHVLDEGPVITREWAAARNDRTACGRSPNYFEHALDVMP